MSSSPQIHRTLRLGKPGSLIVDDTPAEVLAEASKLDLVRWSGLPSWTIKEAVTIVSRQSPDYEEIVRRFHDQRRSKWYGHPPAVRGKLKVHAIRAVAVGEITDPIRPPDFIQWARARRFRVDPALIAALEAAGASLPDWQAKFQETARDLAKKDAQLARAEAATATMVAERDEAVRQLAEMQKAAAEKPANLHPRKEEAFQRMLLGMAIAGFGYNPTQDRNSAVPAIRKALEEMGLKTDEKTILGHLRDASQAMNRRTSEFIREKFSADLP